MITGTPTSSRGLTDFPCKGQTAQITGTPTSSRGLTDFPCKGQTTG